MTTEQMDEVDKMTVEQRLVEFLTWARDSGYIKEMNVSDDQFPKVARRYASQAVPEIDTFWDALTEHKVEQSGEVSLAKTPVEAAVEAAVDEAMEGHGILDRLVEVENRLAALTPVTTTVEIIQVQPFGRDHQRQYMLRIDGALYRATPVLWTSPGPGGAIRGRGGDGTPEGWEGG